MPLQSLDVAIAASPLRWLIDYAELASYDAVAQNGAATELMGVGTLTKIARQLVRSIESSITVDWFSLNRCAKLSSHIRRLLARHDYPPDHERVAVDLVIRRIETFDRSGFDGADLTERAGGVRTAGKVASTCIR